jgi:hypothetical protein
MYVSQGPGTTVHAQSTDLIHWTDQYGGTTSFDALTSTDPAGIGSGVAVLKEEDGITPIVVDGKYWMVYFHGFSGGSMYLASADTSDLLTWTTCYSGSPMLAGSSGWHSSLWTPSFARIGNTYYVYYQGGTPSGWALGFVKADAYSGENPIPPDNAVWTDCSGPVVTGIHGWDNGGCQDPMLREFDGTYYLFYTGTGDPWTNGFCTSDSPEGPWVQYGEQGGGGPVWTRTGTPTVSDGIIRLSSGQAVQSPDTYLPGRALGFRGRFYRNDGTYKWGGFINGISAPFLNIETLGDSDPINLTLTTYSGGRYWVSFGLPPGTFRVYEITWLSSIGSAYIDHSSTPAGSLTSAIPAGPLPVVFRNHNDGANTLDVDWVYVRQYRDPEPGVEVGGEEPTAVTLASFTAEASAGRITVRWETASEFDILGFHLYRLQAPDGAYVQLDEALIRSQNPGEQLGAVYTWLDEAVEPGGTYSYWLEDVDIYGHTAYHGPVSAVVPASPAYSIYLPLVHK